MRESFPSTDPWDLVIIGCGPAGSTTARVAAEAGLRVLVLEKRRRIGRPVFCAEYIPRALLREVSIPLEAVAQKVDHMVTWIQGKVAVRRRLPGIMLHRDLMDEALAAEARRAGAMILTQARVLAVHGGTVRFLHGGRLHLVRSPVIVGADGPLSLTARSMGLSRGDHLISLQVELPLLHPLHETEVHFLPEIYAGYAWVFPKGATANVGLALRPSGPKSPIHLLQGFVDELRKRGVVGDTPPLRRSGGLIPVGGPPRRTTGKGVLLVGDAAGQTDPITGGGIPAAILCGKMAGTAVVEASQRGDPTLLRPYEAAWRDRIGQTLERALRRRRSMEEQWYRKPFHLLVREHWIAFPQYYEEKGP